MEFKDNWNTTLKIFRFSYSFKSSNICQSLQRHLHFIISSLLFSFFLSIPAKGICPVCGGLQFIFILVIYRLFSDFMYGVPLFIVILVIYKYKNR